MIAVRLWNVISGLAMVAVAVFVATSGSLAHGAASADLSPTRVSPVEWPEPLLEVSQVALPVATVSSPVTPMVTPIPPAPAVLASNSISPTPLAGWPVEGRMTQGFGCSVFYTGIPGPGCPAGMPWFHDGVDVAARVGTPVQTAMAGTVIFAGPDGSGPSCGTYRGYGLGVVVNGVDGWQTLYAHLSRIDVVIGQAVTPETVIGLTGESGCVSGPHLHFGLRQYDTLVDPYKIRNEKKAKE
jgi:murein DD-endopeptidase MepM/ murein hydrolase activator NlpD